MVLESSTSKSATMSKTHLIDGICLNSEQCGLLSVEEERLSNIIKKEPITNVYDVEQTPFARGKFAAVRRCTHRETGVPYAAKFIRKRRRAMDQRQDILHEVAVLQLAADSARIVRLHEVYETAAEMALVLEMAEGGELQHILDTMEAMEERHIITVMRQILDGLCFLHQRNIAHLDLKPQNLLLTGVYPDCDIKLCDFGISRIIQPGIEVREILGTPDYVAPEILKYEPISLATDIWSVGVLAYVLVSGGYSPFAGDSKQETFCNISQCNLNFPLELFSDASNLAKDFICATLNTNPNSRLTSEQCLSHPWLSGVAPDINTSLTLTVTTTPDTFPQSNGLEPQANGAEQTKESAGPACANNHHLPEKVHPAGVNKDESLCDYEVGEINSLQRHNIFDSKSCSCSSEEERDDLPVHKRPKNSPEGRRSSFPISSCLCCRRSESPLSSEFLKGIGCQHRHYTSQSVGILLDRSIIY